MCWSLALIWSVDHAGANYYLLTYTSWPWHAGLFSITSPEIRLQLSFLFLARRATWLHLHQVRTIMCVWRKCQLLIPPTVLIVLGLTPVRLNCSFLQQSSTESLCFVLRCAECCNPNITYSSSSSYFFLPPSVLFSFSSWIEPKCDRKCSMLYESLI